MKKCLSVCLAMLLILTAVSCLFAVSAEGGNPTPVLLLDGNALDVVVGFNNMEGVYDYTKGYITLRAQKAAEGVPVDPYYCLLFREESEDAVRVAPYLVFMYRIQEGSTVAQGQLFMAESGGASEAHSMKVPYTADGEWHKAIVCLNDLPGSAFNSTTKLLRYVRFDFDDGAITGEECMDVEYFAFFETEEEALAYEHPLLKMEEVQIGQADDGSYRTFDFSVSGTLSMMFSPVRNQISVEEGVGCAIFTAEGDDPYIQFTEVLGYTDLQVSGTQASYIVVKYMTDAASKKPMKIEFYTGVRDDMETSWGANTHAEAELVNDGAWHYVMVDATATIGTHTSMLHSFRIDPLASAKAGDSIAIEFVKLFEEENAVLEYLEELADEGDEAAIDFFDRLNAEPETAETTPVDTTPDETEPAESESAEEVLTTEAATTEAAAEESSEDETTAAATEAATTKTDDDAAASGCKAVVAPAALMAVAALTVGVVIGKKKD